MNPIATAIYLMALAVVSPRLSVIGSVAGAFLVGEGNHGPASHDPSDVTGSTISGLLSGPDDPAGCTARWGCCVAHRC